MTLKDKCSLSTLHLPKTYEHLNTVVAPNWEWATSDLKQTLQRRMHFLLWPSEEIHQESKETILNDENIFVHNVYTPEKKPASIARYLIAPQFTILSLKIYELKMLYKWIGLLADSQNAFLFIVKYK